MSIKINAQTVIFKSGALENTKQEKCEYCHVPFKTIMVPKVTKNTGAAGMIKTEIPIEVSGEYFDYCPKCRRRLN